MAGNLEYVLCKRGHDARDFVLVATGGATATHVARIAQQVGISKYMIPKSAPTFCASGMLYADMKHNYLRSYVRPTHVADMNVMNRILRRRNGKHGAGNVGEGGSRRGRHDSGKAD